jgi:hypothetical protein
MKVQIISVDIDADIEKADKSGTYQGVLISFKNVEKNTLQQKGIHNNVISKNPELLAKLKALNKGDNADFKFEANGKFQNLVDVVVAVRPSSVVDTTNDNVPKYSKANDALKQISICKQSAIAQIVNLLTAAGNISTVDDELIDFIIEKAERIVKYTHGD